VAKPVEPILTARLNTGLFGLDPSKMPGEILTFLAGRSRHLQTMMAMTKPTAFMRMSLRLAGPTIDISTQIQ
jgi:hypothetical protein